MFRLLPPLLFLVLLPMVSSAQTSPTQLRAVYWGDPIVPALTGYNARVINEIDSIENCALPDTADGTQDWRTEYFRNQIAKVKPGILRFPGGTAANYWFMKDETRQVVNTMGNLQEVTICEGSFVNIPESIYMGCEDPWKDLNAETWDAIHTVTSTRLDDFLATTEYFRDEKSFGTQEMFVLSVFDPFYHMGSPQFEYEFGGLSNFEKQNKLAEKGALRATKQVNQILSGFCGDCESYDGEVYFQLGNEIFLQRYGKFLPRDVCFDMEDPCETCFADVALYGDQCEFLIPYIKSKFPNSRVALSAGRPKVMGLPWNQYLIDRFGPGNEVQTDAMFIHYYPPLFPFEELTTDLCEGNLSGFNVPSMFGQLMFYAKALISARGTDTFADSDIELWITEFNLANGAKFCDPASGDSEESETQLFYHNTWSQSMGIFAMMNAFFTYSSNGQNPWYGYDKMVDFRIMCLHSLFAYPTSAALLRNGMLGASGITFSLLSDLMTGSSSMRQVMLYQNSQLLPTLPDGSLDPAAQDNLEPYTYEVPPSQYNLLEESYHAPRVLAWAFEADSSFSIAAANFSDSPASINMSALPEMSNQVELMVYSVSSDSVFAQLTTGLNSSAINADTLTIAASNILLPAYSIAVIKSLGNTAEPDPCPGVTASSESSIPKLCGSTPCPPCDCEFTLWNTANFEIGNGIWQKEPPEQTLLNNTPLPPGLQNLYPVLGSNSLRFSAGTPYPAIVSPAINTANLHRVEVRFNFGAKQLTSASDRIVLAYSIDGGASYQLLSSWNYDTHFENNKLYEAVFYTNVPYSPQTKFAVQAQMNGNGKMIIVDNLKLSYCLNPSTSNSIAPIPIESIEPFSAQASLFDFSLFPNPASQNVWVRTSGGSSSQLQLRLYDLKGQLLHAEVHKTSQDHEDILFDTSAQLAGMYIVEVCDDGGNCGRRKLVLVK